MKVGLTGGIGSGKTTVGNFFEALGVPCYNSDKWAKHLMANNTTLINQIQNLFAGQAYQNGVLNKGFVAQQVFNNKEILLALNKIVHPAVKKHFCNWYRGQQSFYVIQETALIFEHENSEFYDATILVTAPTQARINRLKQRDGSTIEEIKARMQNQLPDAQKMPLATFVIHNDDLTATKSAVKKIHLELLKKAVK